MKHTNESWIDQTGLNLIRIVIGSYFMAVSLDLVAGVDQMALFTPVTPPMVADLIGSTLLFSISVAFMTGVYLRMTALMLALFVLSSSLIQNFVQFELANVSGFWRDITLACAVILNYSSMGRRELRHASVVAHRVRHARLIRDMGAAGSGGVIPRRVSLTGVEKRPVQSEIRSALAPAPGTPPKPIFRHNHEATQDDECENIFASV